jgi:SAM-dependent methyltransferase
VGTRLATRNLPHDDLRQGSVLDIPWQESSFDIVFSHGVLHHVPDIHAAQREIHRVLQPGGRLIVMLYARRSLNYQVSIRWVRRAAVAAAFPLRRWVPTDSHLGQHVANAERQGLRHYLDLDTFVHRNTDGPLNPFSRVYDLDDVRRDFPDFVVERAFQVYMHAPPLPVHRLPGAARWGWHLWVHLRAVDDPGTAG